MVVADDVCMSVIVEVRPHPTETVPTGCLVIARSSWNGVVFAVDVIHTHNVPARPGAWRPLDLVGVDRSIIH